MPSDAFVKGVAEHVLVGGSRAVFSIIQAEE